MYKVLIVDDIQEDIDMMGLMLPEGLDYESAKSYIEAIKILKEKKFDIAIIDVRLNEADESNKEGMKLLEYIKENYKDLKVIIVSAYKGFEYKMEALDKGAECFLEKPLNPENYREAIERSLGLKK